ncbi:MAG: hypothetical protein JKY37_17820 [Nannocystaceae bacterium]|nr:hypothetical protein [Nannocystaceae bacterium]
MQLSEHEALARALLAAKPILVSKLAVACQVDHSGAERLLTEVLRFLELCAASEKSLTPSPRIDGAWHEFVLCTREYSEFCQRRFGRFVHHDPGGTVEGNRRQFQRTLRAYAVRFGPPDPAYWGDAACEIPTADCGSCESASDPA